MNQRTIPDLSGLSRDWLATRDDSSMVFLLKNGIYVGGFPQKCFILVIQITIAGVIKHALWKVQFSTPIKDDTTRINLVFIQGWNTLVGMKEPYDSFNVIDEKRTWTKDAGLFAKQEAEKHFVALY